MTVVAAPQKDSYLLVEILYGNITDNPQYARYTDWSDDVLGIEGDTFSSVPTMEVKISPITGHLQERATTIALPFDTFTDRVTNGEPFSSVFCKVWEVVLNSTGVEYFLCFAGRVIGFVRQDNGNRKRVRFTCANWKDILSTVMSLPASQHCIWGSVGDHNCKADIEPGIAQGTITQINNTQIVATGLPSHASDPTQRYWHSGYVEKDGIQIRIRDWHQTSPTVFLLQRKAPADWLGEIVTFIPGCDRRIRTCIERWNNVDRFMGFGISIPNHNPLFELPAQK